MPDIKTTFSILTILITAISYTPYIRDTIKGKTTPHAFTWFTFTLVNLFVYFLQSSAGAGVGSFIILFTSILVFIVFCLSLFKGEKHITLSDVGFLVLSLVALSLWLMADQAILSVVLLSIVNALALGPTIRKSWDKPFSETLSTYVINGSRHGLSLLALERYNLVTYLFPISATVITFAFVFILIIRRKIIKSL